MRKDLKGFVCVVTGASRGIGRGIAIVLGQYGATVYVTGRTLEPQDKKAGSLKEVVDEINKRGGNGIPVPLDHNDETQIFNLFNRIKKEQNGRLDLFVNNAFTGVQTILNDLKTPRDGFWDSRPNETPGEYWDIFNKVGVRNAYACCCYAAKTMLEYRGEAERLPQGSKRVHNSTLECPASLIVNISSSASVRYMFNPASNAGKAATDRMSMDMAVDLIKHQSTVAVVSLWPGSVATEEVVSATKNFRPDMYETTELAGRVISHLLRQNKERIMAANGHIIQTATYARSNWITDTNGRYPLPITSVKLLLKRKGWEKLSYFVPAFIRVPDMFLKLAAYKLY